MRHNFLLIICTSLLILIGYMAWSSLQIPNNEIPEGDQAQTNLATVPKFSFKTLSDKTLNIKDISSKVILIHFWASWCAPCVIELPKLVKLAEDFPEDITIIAVSSDTDRVALDHFLKRTNLTAQPSNFIITLDDTKVITQDIFQTIKLPETIILNHKFEMVEKIAGDAAWDSPELRHNLKEIMNYSY
jgi:cytochrome c biogenesis protein CcmG/thiol:disulfide interchange protein DsbE